MNEVEKKAAGEAAADMVRDGMTLGLGSGTTVDYFLRALGERVLGGMRIRGVPTSERTAHLCRRLGIDLLDFTSVDEVDLTVDGADEVDDSFRMIKGGGGALLREKMVAIASRQIAIVVDSSKLVTSLGNFPLAVEVTRFGHHLVERKLRERGIPCRLRISGDDPYITDNGHYILDCRMGIIEDPIRTEAGLKGMNGIVATGLFIGLCDTLIVGRGKDVEIRRRQSPETREIGRG
ncbi:MAG: ribose-5-phosphate isomerase RpiA [Alphaproteobacteria bacterium]